MLIKIIMGFWVMAGNSFSVLIVFYFLKRPALYSTIVKNYDPQFKFQVVISNHITNCEMKRWLRSFSISAEIFLPRKEYIYYIVYFLITQILLTKELIQ